MKAAMGHLPVVVALAASLGLGFAGLSLGTWAVGGSDSACYGLMAKTLASGELQPAMPLVMRVPWPDAAATLAPAGFVASPVRRDAASPICAPGFSLLLVPFVWLGGSDGVFWATPFAGILLVWFAFLLGRRLAGRWAGALAAVLVATSPIVLYQVVQPMNDVTAALLWLLVVVALSAGPACGQKTLWTAGALTGLALLVRPNLLPAALLTGIAVPFVLRQAPDFAFHPAERTYSVRGEPVEPRTQADQAGHDRIRGWLPSVLIFAAAALPGIAVVGWLNAKLYGSALQSGYGDLGQLFAASFIPTNLIRYSRWLVDSHTVFPLFALAAPFVCARAHRGVIGLALGIAAAITGVYLAYRPFQEWWYLRFLLPAVVLALVLSAAAAAALAGRVHRDGAAMVCAVLAVALGLLNVRAADRGLAFSLHVLEQRFRDTGLLVRDRLSPNAIFFSGWQSGTVRFYAGNETVLWDSFDPSSLDDAIAWLVRSGYRPYILVDRNEETPYRQRFEGISRAGPLDWPPIFDIDRQTRIFDPADRARYLAGEGIRTEDIWGAGGKR